MRLRQLNVILLEQDAFTRAGGLTAAAVVTRHGISVISSLFTTNLSIVIRTLESANSL